MCVHFRAAERAQGSGSALERSLGGPAVPVQARLFQVPFRPPCLWSTGVLTLWLFLTVVKTRWLACSFIQAAVCIPHTCENTSFVPQEKTQVCSKACTGVLKFKIPQQCLNKAMCQNDLWSLFFQTLPSCPWPALLTRELWSWWRRYDAVVTQACMFSKAPQVMWKLLPLWVQTCPVWCFPGPDDAKSSFP